MKKMFVGLAACALIFTSCSKNEVLENTSPSNAIRFSNLNNRPTKAANDDPSSYNVFAVWSDFKTAWYMDIRVENDDSYSPARYWPENGQLDFYAYCPYGLTTSTIKSDTIASLEIKYTVPKNAQEDFTIATPKRGQTRDSSVVALSFNHMLSKITMNVKLDGMTGYELIHDSTLVTFTLPYNSAIFDVMRPDTMTLGAKVESVYVMNPKGHDSKKTGFLNVLPQPKDNDGKFQLQISVKQSNINTTIIKNKLLLPIDLKNVLPKGGELKAGKWYQFEVNITKDAADGGGDPVFKAIKITSKTAEWDEELFNPTQPEVKP